MSNLTTQKAFPYFVGNVILQSAYFRFPVTLVTDERFAKMSWLERMTYVMLLDKASYAYRMGKLDEYGRPYIDDFTRKDIMSISGCSEETAKRVLKNLGSASGVGLIESVIKPGSANIIYVKDFTSSQVHEPENPDEKYNYIYQDTLFQYQYWMIPQAFFTNKEYESVSFESKLIYAVLLSRTALSQKNQWKDENERIFIHYSVRELRTTFKFSPNKIVSALSELVDLGLITRFYDKPNNRERIYVHNFIATRDVKKQIASPVNGSQNAKSTEQTKTDNNETDVRPADPETQKEDPVEGGHIDNTRGVKTITPRVKSVTPGGSNQYHPGSYEYHQGGQNDNTPGVKTITPGGSNQYRIYNKENITELSYNKDILFSSSSEKSETKPKYEFLMDDEDLDLMDDHINDRDDHNSDAESLQSESVVDLDTDSDQSDDTLAAILQNINLDEIRKEFSGQSKLVNSMLSVLKNVFENHKSYRFATNEEMRRRLSSLDESTFKTTLVNVANSLSTIKGRLEPFVAAALYNNAEKASLVQDNKAHPIVSEDTKNRMYNYIEEIKLIRHELEDSSLPESKRAHLLDLINLKETGLKYYFGDRYDPVNCCIRKEAF